MSHIRYTQFCFYAVLLTFFAPACASALGFNVATLEGRTMGTYYQAKFTHHGPRDTPFEPIQQQIQATLDHVDQLMSTYKPNSELSRLNSADMNEWVEMSPETLGVLQHAINVGKETGGAFDVTVGPIVKLWNFGPDPSVIPDVPTDEEIETARAKTGLDAIEIDELNGRVRKTKPDLYIDLSGIAKGYAADQVVEMLCERNHSNCMVEIGGEIRTSGYKGGGPWSIGIERPEAGQVGALQQVIRLSGKSHAAAIATSGDYRNYFEKDGQRFSHIVDPRTGRPIDHTLVSVSVLGDSCARADALATALSVMGPELGPEFAEENNIAALFLIRDPANDMFVELATTKWDRLTADASKDSGNTDQQENAWPSIIATFLLTLAVFAFAFGAILIGNLRGRPRPTCECGAAKQLMVNDEARRNAKKGQTDPAKVDPTDLPILPN